MKREIYIQAVYEIHETLIESLSYMGTLNMSNIPRMEEDLEEPLRQLFQFAKNRMKLGGRDRYLPCSISFIRPVLDPRAPEWVSDTDMRHTIASLGYLLEICRGENFTLQDKKILASAMIVHDCAYPVTKNFAGFTNPQARISHMKDAENEFQNYAKSINKQFPGFYSNTEIDLVCKIVSQHDNPGIKVNGKPLEFSYDPPPPTLLWVHREADRLWMLDKAGFALDLVRRLVESNPWYDPAKYLNHVISKHLEEGQQYFDCKKCIMYKGEKSLYKTNTGFQIFLRLIEERRKEYE